MDIHFYADSRGHQPVYDWILRMKKREPHIFRRTIHLLNYLEENGKLIQSGVIKQLKGTEEIWQLRINENRVLFFYYAGDCIVLTNHFMKKTKKTPVSEIKLSQRRKKDWIQRNH